jgi:proteasome lid subunit RPN8/RPN11
MAAQDRVDSGQQNRIEAYLGLPAFLTIVSSSVEVFRRETIGYLIGFKSERKFMVEYAIPYQTAESTPTHATLDENRVGRINQILEKLSQGLEYIGDFHSHTLYGDLPGTVLPSGTDLVSSVPGELNIICAVNFKKKNTAWRENRRGILTGTVDKYRIEIGGYYFAKAHFGRNYQRVLIKCPAVTGIQEAKRGDR